MKVADYAHDPTMIGFMNYWQLHHQPPEPLVDYLLEIGAENGAENVRWAVSQWGREGWDGTQGGIRPFEFSPNEFKWGRGHNLRSGIGIREYQGKELAGQINFPTYHSALIAFMDSYENL